ncbi:thioredoxin family protein [Candidatus Woesearchaeota archaeon]|nr:thioredoxin family protein [Candidatus Woesearchaeota archaeon]
MFLKANRKTILLIVILLVLISIIYLEKQKVAPEIKSAQETAELKDGKYPKAPELAGISGYLNTASDLKISELKGKIVLIDFWTYTCINCIRTLPYLIDWHEKYSDKGLVIIGVHTPEFEFEKKYENVKMAAEKYGIMYPIVQDNDYATWNAFRNRYWPRKYLIDKDGFIRYDHIGEGAYAETENKIQELLLEAGMNPDEKPRIEIPDLSNLKQLTITPELYAGYDFALPRNQNIGNDVGLQPEQIADYASPGKINSNIIYLNGKWKSNPDNLEAAENAEIILDFTASEVNIVSAESQELKLEVKVNDNYLTKEQAGQDVIIKDQISYIEIKEPRLYNVYKGDYINGVLELTAEKGFKFSAFTFG